MQIAEEISINTDKIVLNRYKIEELVSNGSFGVVYKGEDIINKRPVAIKELVLEEYIPEEEQETNRQRFLREIETAHRLNHPNVVRIYDSGLWLGRNVMVMEFLSGKTLREYMDTRLNRPIKASLYILLQIANAISYAHTKNIIHRDIKPENIKFSNQFTVKIMDFGTARIQDQQSNLTVNGTFLGTPVYMSPEQLTDPKSVDERADIYSFGVLMYEMLTGKLPFDKKGVTALIVQIMTEAIKSPRNYNELIPSAIEKIILKALQRSQNDRYQKMSELAEDLKSYLKDEEARSLNSH